MAIDFEKRMREEMERASLKDVMPDFDAEQEWIQVADKLEPVRKKISFKVWQYAAALLLVLFATWSAFFIFRRDKEQLVKSAGRADSITAVTNGNYDNLVVPDSSAKAPSVVKSNPDKTKNTDHRITSKYKISNSTDCPMEISISQTMKCPNSRPAAISSSSTLEPGQSATLNYKAIENVPKNCSLTVEEIEIRSTVTGESIRLDAHSSPSTAEEVFSYISGEKRGDVLAGMLNMDCNKRNSRHSLRIDNRAGDVIMQ
jgi:hypothetical protein